jgi:Cu-Zn family superoxide dismutase
MNNIIGTVFFDHKNIKGSIDFVEDIETKTVKIVGELQSNKYKNSIHGFHIHEAGDLTDSCVGACSHFNPYGKKHGGPDSKERHVGDLGNIRFDAKGVSVINMKDSVIKLRGTKCNIMGRSLVIHEGIDDLGTGNDAESLITGNAGARITCGVVGYSKKMFK